MLFQKRICKIYHEDPSIFILYKILFINLLIILIVFLNFLNLFFVASVELRELEAKLKAGFMNRERSAQLAEKMAMELDRKVLYIIMYHFKGISVSSVF